MASYNIVEQCHTSLEPVQKPVDVEQQFTPALFRGQQDRSVQNAVVIIFTLIVSGLDWSHF